ncbi:MAG: hypothetical protein GEU95_02375 [Rhizobiales bacterium]|nr:hypothetical protein [Hyphomicrobiales bacterium]
MDQSTIRQGSERRGTISDLSRFVAASVEAARVKQQPFFHLEFDRVFPDDVYRAMLAAMPRTTSYRRSSRKDDILADGTVTRAKIDLFPEYIRGLPAEQRGLWSLVGAALCSCEVSDAMVRKLAPALARRFGPKYAAVGFYPIPTLTRDGPGYSINIHSDHASKGITVQFYLPTDNSTTHIGTIFHAELADGSRPPVEKKTFAPNTGYAFAVDRDTHHSVDTVGPDVKTRDSILLTYYVDAGPTKFLRNRGKRIGNFLLNEMQAGLRRLTSN